MPFFRRPSTPPPVLSGPLGYQPELRVIAHVVTRKGEPEGGPQIRLCAPDIRIRVLTAGELVWVHGVRGKQLAELVHDDEVPEHACIVRDLPGVSVADGVRVTRPDLDSPPRSRV